MRRIILLLVISIFIHVAALAQLITFGKTLPVRSISLTFAPLYHIQNDYHPDLYGLSYMLTGGYGIKYDLDIGIKYGNTYSLNKTEGMQKSTDYFGIDLQYMFRETNENYYSVSGGLHKWEEFGMDMSFSYTFMPAYFIYFSACLDIDVDFTNIRKLDNPSIPELRAWIPLNMGFNIKDRYFLFFEYDLAATERAWNIVSGGLTFIFR